MKLKAVTILFFLLNAASCNNVNSNYHYQPPAQKGDGLQVATKNEPGIDTSLIMQAVARIENGNFREIHSILIYKNDRLVFEEYFDGHQYKWDGPGHKGDFVSWNSEMLHCIHSVTKSITSLCIGIAIDKGFIQSVNQSIFDYLPEHVRFKTDDWENLTIEHLLTMNSGVLWNEWGVSLASIENDQIGIWFWEDGPMDFVLRRDFDAEPGTQFNYSGGDIQILVEILKNATGMPIDDFSKKHLFEPMGITSFEWWLKFNTGEIQGAGGLKLTPREMVKVGAMMLNGGMWNGQQIISEEWVLKCSKPHRNNYGIKVPGEDFGKFGYSYTWWTKHFRYKNEEISMYMGLGWGGQKIMVLPEVNTVVVFTGAIYQSNVKHNKILTRYILPALEQN